MTEIAKDSRPVRSRSRCAMVYFVAVIAIASCKTGSDVRRPGTSSTQGAVKLDSLSVLRTIPIGTDQLSVGPIAVDSSSDILAAWVDCLSSCGPKATEGLALVDSQTGHRKSTVAVAAGCSGQEMAPTLAQDGHSHIFVGSCTTDRLFAIDVQSHKVVSQRSLTRDPSALVADGEAGKLYVGSGSQLSEFRSADLKHLNTLDTKRPISEIVLDGSSAIYISHPDSTIVSVIDATTFRIRQEFDAGIAGPCIAFDARNKKLYMKGAGSAALLIRDSEGKTVRQTIETLLCALAVDSAGGVIYAPGGEPGVWGLSTSNLSRKAVSFGESDVGWLALDEKTHRLFAQQANNVVIVGPRE